MLSRNRLMCLLHQTLHHGRLQDVSGTSRGKSFQRICTCPYDSSSFQRLQNLGMKSRHFHLTACRKGTDGYSSTGKVDSTLSDGSETKESYLEASRKGVLKGRRTLSPMERIGGMIMNNPETEERTKNQNTTSESETSGIRDSKDVINADEIKSAQVCDSSHVQRFRTSVDGETSVKVSDFDKAQHQGPPLVDGEYIIITRENLKRQEKLVRLIKLDASQDFKCKFGNLRHADIVGHQSGSVFVTDIGIELLIRRPSLDEYVLYMKRHPTIAYPKDCCTMLMMIDAYPGDVVLEAGSGSGAMTLFLSRAVGHHGQVLSFDRERNHQVRAEKNLSLWQKSYDISHEVKWPQNVLFYSCRLQDCGEYIKDTQVDGAIIDMEEPSRVMSTMSQRLKPGKAMAVYVANLTMVIEIAEAIRIERLPLFIETTIEVTHKEWVVNPARRYGGIVLQDPKASDEQEFENEVVGKSKGVRYIADEIPKYLARPHHIQPSHTAFLVKIRKTRKSSSTFKV
nr:tRNA (adenine(58)-N(1))-methyltransferase, mitochondrial-like [Lytechinus pictus]